MKKFFYGLCGVCFVVLSMMLAVACSSDNDNKEAEPVEVPPTTPDENKVCIDWNASQEDVRREMEAYELTDMGKDFLCYKGVGMVTTISYNFADEKLQAALLLYDQSSTLKSEITTQLSKYEHVGEVSNHDVYVDRDNNVLVSVSTQTHGNHRYYAVGYCSLNP